MHGLVMSGKVGLLAEDGATSGFPAGVWLDFHMDRGLVVSEGALLAESLVTDIADVTLLAEVDEFDVLLEVGTVTEELAALGALEVLALEVNRVEVGLGDGALGKHLGTARAAVGATLLVDNSDVLVEVGLLAEGAATARVRTAVVAGTLMHGRLVGVQM